MSNSSNIITGLNIPSQIPLDVKTFAINENGLKNLGVANNLAFAYYEGLVVYCQEEKTKWEWRALAYENEQGGLLLENFTYPNNHVVFNKDYSLQVFNFFPVIRDNIDIVKYFAYTETDSSSLINAVNSLPAYTVSEIQSVWIKAVKRGASRGVPGITTLWKVKNIGKGTYGTGGTTLTVNDNLEFIRTNQATSLDILADETTSIIELTAPDGVDITNKVEVIEMINTYDTAVIIKPLSEGQTVLRIDDGENTLNYWWVGESPKVLGLDQYDTAYLPEVVLLDDVPITPPIANWKKNYWWTTGAQEFILPSGVIPRLVFHNRTLLIDPIYDDHSGEIIYLGEYTVSGEEIKTVTITGTLALPIVFDETEVNIITITN